MVAAENDLDVLYDWRRAAAADIVALNSSHAAFASAVEKQLIAAERRLADMGEAVHQLAGSVVATAEQVYNKGGRFCSKEWACLTNYSAFVGSIQVG